jgi:hypothetical protein
MVLATRNDPTKEPTVQTIPVTDIRPGDLVDTGNAAQPGPVIRVAAVATVGGMTYLVQRDPGALVPQGYRFHDVQHVDLYDRKV